MEIIRVKRDKNYTVVSNVYLRDEKLTLRAKGLMTLILSFPDNWELTVGGIISITPEGRDAVKKTMKELIDSGYCKVRKIRGESGRFDKNDYTFCESPFTEKPSTVKPSTEKHTQLSTDKIKYCINDKYKKRILKFCESITADSVYVNLINDGYTKSEISQALDEVRKYHIAIENPKGLNYTKFKEHLYNKVISHRNKNRNVRGIKNSSTVKQSEL